MTVLLTVLTLINFLDKIVIGMVAVPLMAALHLSPAEFGVIAGGFFWLFSLSTIAVGMLAGRIQTRWLLLAMSVTWALVQIPQAFAASALSLFVCRLLLGAAEGPFSPTTIHALYKWFPDRKRNLPVAVVSQGAGLGLLLAGLVIPHITQHWGWRMNFVLLAVIGALGSLLWLCFGREGKLATPRTTAAASLASEASEPPGPERKLRTTLCDPSVLCVFLLGFAAYWSLGLVFTWLPAYLEKGLGFSNIAAGRWFALVIVTAAPVSVGVSGLSQFMLGRGISTRVARVQVVSVALLASSALYVAPLLFSFGASAKVLLLAVGAALPTVCFAVGPALLAEVVPDRQRGLILAIHTAVASIGAAIAPAVMGAIVQARGTQVASACEMGFATCAILSIIAALLALCWLHPERSRRALDTPLQACESPAI